MAWQNVAQTMKLLASLGDAMNDSGKGKGKGSKGKGKDNGKGKGKGKGAAQAPAPMERTCRREGCRAAERKQATWGGACNCHACGLSLTATLPVEQLCSWAYEQRLEERRASAKKDAKPGQPAAAAKAKAVAKPALSTEQLAERRTERLAALKEATDKGPTPPTPTEEVAQVFNASPTKSVGVKAQVDQPVADMCAILNEAAAEVVASVRAEVFPTTRPLKPPQEVYDGLLAKCSSFKKDSGLQAAEAALNTSQQLIATMQASGTDPQDEILRLMVAREEKQRKELEKLQAAKPSQQLRKDTLQSLRADYCLALQAQADGRAAGATKAKDRTKARTTTVDKIIEAATILKNVEAEMVTELSTAHQERTAAKVEQGAAVLELIDSKIEEVEDEDLNFEDPDSVDPTPPTDTERDRDEAQRLTGLLEQQVLQFRAAAAVAQAKIAEQAVALEQAAANAPPPAPADTDADNDPASDLWREMKVDLALIPKLENLAPDVELQLATLAAFFAAVPWGSPLPAITFHVMGAHPSTVHTIVGDHLWREVWKEKADKITNSFMVPFSLVNVLKHAVEAAKVQPSDTVVAEGVARLLEAKKIAANRRQRNSPY